jgi:TPR repeat protein
MSPYPSLVEYNAAVQNPRTAFSDPILKNGRAETTGLGIPKALGGGFAITYNMQSGSKQYAVRCFHKNVPELEQRYNLIGTKLRSTQSKYFVGFEYQANGISVNAFRYPIVRMDWASGSTLGMWLETNNANPSALTQLRQQFLELEDHLNKQGCAHGDLQNGNVIVKQNICLIDYEGFYVPGLPLGRGAEIGHKHFQHPRRSANDFGPHMDRFSFIVIDFSLRILVALPHLFAKYSNGENIIFGAADFADPAQSDLIQEVHNCAQLRRDASNFASVCAAPIDQVPRLGDFLAGRNIPSQSIIVPTTPGSPPQLGRPRQPYVGAYDVFAGIDFCGVADKIGDRIELVGQIVEVKNGRTKYRKPYVFLSFDHWQNPTVKINIWSEGLDRLTRQPDRSWKGVWTSVTGLVDPIYTGRRRGTQYTCVSVTVTEPNQLRVIGAAEAQRRLASAGRSGVVPTVRQVPPPGTSRNGQILRRLGVATGVTRATPPSGVGSQTPPTKSQNWQVLTRLGIAGPAIITGSMASPPPTPVASPPVAPVTIGAQHSKSRSAPLRWLLVFGFLITILIIALYQETSVIVSPRTPAPISQPTDDKGCTKATPPYSGPCSRPPTSSTGSFEDGTAAFDRGDYATAMRLLRPFADQGNADAQTALGAMYTTGKGVPRDDAEAAKWFRMAADQGNADAQTALGAMYTTGKGVPRDDAEAAKWFRMAADQGNADAQAQLGIVYSEGYGVERDYAEAAKWFRMAADQGNAFAQTVLGFIFGVGKGVPRDDAESAKWFRMAADQGNANAQAALGGMYGSGKGVPQDYVSAHMWFALAAAGGNKDAASNRDKVAVKMTPSQIAEAQRLAREWKLRQK